MPIEIAVPRTGVTFDDRGSLMRISGLQDGPLELRVDEGLVFARYLAREPRTWSDVSLPSVLALFAENSPVASFLRRQGAVPLRQLVLDAMTTGDDATP